MQVFSGFPVFHGFPWSFQVHARIVPFCLSVHSGQRICPVNIFAYSTDLCSSKTWLLLWQMPSFLSYLPFASSAFGAVPITLLNDKQQIEMVDE